MHIETNREYQLDNAKALLIFLVVFGHIIETNLAYGINRTLYIIIYSFHMPFFAYITGYFAKPGIRKIFSKFVMPYLIFQTLYIVFSHYILNKSVTLQYKKPYWILWYLMAVLWWNLFLLFFKKANERVQSFVFAIVTAAALLCGYIDAIGREWTLSRAVVFLPYFLWGYRNRTKSSCGERKNSNKLIYLCIVVCIGVIYVVQAQHLNITWFYEAVSYAKGGYALAFRMFHMMGAAGIILCLKEFLPKKKIKGISYLGKNTMPTYLLHGFVIKWVGTFHLFTAVITLAVTVFGGPLIGYLQTFLTSFFFAKKQKNDGSTQSRQRDSNC